MTAKPRTTKVAKPRTTKVAKPDLPRQQSPPAEEFQLATSATLLFRQMIIHSAGRFKTCTCGHDYFCHPSFGEQLEHIATMILLQFTVTPKDRAKQ